MLGKLYLQSLEPRGSFVTSLTSSFPDDKLSTATREAHARLFLIMKVQDPIIFLFFSFFFLFSKITNRPIFCWCIPRQQHYLYVIDDDMLQKEICCVELQSAFLSSHIAKKK